jgi:ligand-binding sensor domain-containing protein
MVKLLASILFFISLNIYSQDSLLLVKKSRIEWCVQQKLTVDILTERMLVKDSIIILTNERLTIKDSIISVQAKDIATYKVQIATADTLRRIDTDRVKFYKEKSRNLQKRINRLQYGGGAALLALLLFAL